MLEKKEKKKHKERISDNLLQIRPVFNSNRISSSFLISFEWLKT
jgi:hypothetical protein